LLAIVPPLLLRQPLVVAKLNPSPVYRGPQRSIGAIDLRIIHEMPVQIRICWLDGNESLTASHH
jgi:hypothetical protein